MLANASARNAEISFVFILNSPSGKYTLSEGEWLQRNSGVIQKGVFHFSGNRPEGWHKRPNFLDKTFGTFFLSTHLKHTQFKSTLVVE